MTRLEALEELQWKINSFAEYLHGGYLKDHKNGFQPHAIDIAADSEEVEELDSLACGCDDVLGWIFKEIAKEEKEYEDIQDEIGNTRDMYDETGHKRGDF